jgi:hypothetical protein
MRATGTRLWVEHKDITHVPDKVWRLQEYGLTIATCENGLRSYSKIIPSLEAFPNSYIVTADDDYIYPRSWLSGLVDAANSADEVLCYRAHEILLDQNGNPKPFRTWSRTSAVGKSSKLVFALGYGGVLYPPGILGSSATDRLCLQLSPTGDDIWLYFMARMNGAVMRRIPGARAVRLPSADIQSLKEVNVANEQAMHQRNLDAMVERFGFPT